MVPDEAALRFLQTASEQAADGQHGLAGEEAPMPRLVAYPGGQAVGMGVGDAGQQGGQGVRAGIGIGIGIGVVAGGAGLGGRGWTSGCYPPPTGRTISRASPGLSLTAAKSSLRMTCPL